MWLQSYLEFYSMWYFSHMIIGEIPREKIYFSPGLGGVYSIKYGFKFFDLD